MQQLRSLFRRPHPVSLPAVQSTEPAAFYLGGDGRMQAVKASGFVSSTGLGRVGLGFVVAHAEEYVRAAISSVWAANCINLRADSISRLDWYVRERRTHERVEDHPFEFALANSDQNVIRKLERSLLVHGETFLKPLYNDNRFYSGLWVLNNLDVEVDTTRGFISEFRYTPQGYGKTRYYKPKDIAFIYTDNDYDDLRGLSKFEHILLETRIDRDISRTTAAFYQNDARPGILLLVEQDLNELQAEEFVTYWNAQLQGPANAGRTIMVPKVIREVVDFQRAPTLDDVELRESTRREICAAFKIPLSMAGAWDDATYQSLPEQRKFFYEETIIPEAENLARELTRKVLPFFEPDAAHYEVYFDAHNILAMIENAIEKTDIAVKKLTSGAYTINEFREWHDDEPIEGGDIHLMQAGWIPVHTRELATFEAPNMAVMPSENGNTIAEPLALSAQANLISKANFNEADHPRDDTGHFGSGGGGGSSPSDESDNGDISNKPPSWAGPEKRNAGLDQDGYLDYGHMRDNPLNGIGESAAKDVSWSHTGTLDRAHQDEATRYRGDAYRSINSGLRGKGDLNDEDRITVEHLDRAISQNSLSQPTILYRGMAINESLSDRMKPGATFSDQAYTSTSFDQTIATGFAGGESAMMRIRAPKGQNGLAVSTISDFSEEHEFVLPRSTRYQITSVARDPKTNRMYIDAEIIQG